VQIVAYVNFIVHKGNTITANFIEAGHYSVYRFSRPMEFFGRHGVAVVLFGFISGHGERLGPYLIGKKEITPSKD